MNLLKKIIKLLVYPFIFSFGLFIFLFSKKTIPQAFAAFRFYFVFTNGKSNDLASKLVSIFVPKYKISKANGILGELSDKKISTIVNDIELNGFHSFDQKLSPKTIESLIDFASNTKASYLDFNQKNISYSKEKVLFDEDNTISPRYQFSDAQLYHHHNVQNLIFDSSILAIANAYLKTKPILDLVAMWWSVPFDEKAENKAAQMYHFDMDKFKFIKFFFYLTDVDTYNGPHCYVRSSHKRLPKQILEDRRILDNEVNNFYPSENILELLGEKGSIIAVDTRGLHKGKPLLKGKRLLFQIQFSNLLFGAHYNKINNVNLTDNCLTKKAKFKRTYQLIN